MISKLKEHLIRNLINLPGWRTDKKIVVFESDDWGMVRMSSKEAYEWFLNRGYRVDECPYNRNDTLESNEDLELLFEVLSSVKDQNGQSAIFTANNIVANPDFQRIKDSGFNTYYFEPFTETLKRYPGRDRVIELYRQGMNHSIFHPQFHGREHLNVNRWMQELNSGNRVVLDAFEQNMFTVHKSGNINGRRDNLDAFGMGYEKEWVSMKDVINSGLNLFEELWGYYPDSFIAPCYVWPFEIEELLAEAGVQYVQGTHVQRIPQSGTELSIQKKYHYLGQKNRFWQSYLMRNVHFEPAEYGGENSVTRALKEIKTAFRFKKPAIISTHRVNYMGSIRPENRDSNLKWLSLLLDSIVNKYPDVEFMASDELGKLIAKDN